MKYNIRLDICTLCNLNCPACSMRKTSNPPNGLGYLKFEDFKKFIDRDGDKIKYIEISNFGEPFLNPDAIKILEYAHSHNIELDCGNGTNLNINNDNILKAIVDNQVRTLTVSCDGVTQEAYEKYRVNGRVELVFNNIKKLVAYKKEKNSKYPIINWQYILRESTEDEVEMAFAKAKELEVDNLFFKLTWEKSYVPKDPERLKDLTGLQALTRNEFKEKTGKLYKMERCKQLFDCPTINWNGELLGCCSNKHTFGVNVFEVGLENALNFSTFMDSKNWVLNMSTDLDNNNPCANCKQYKKIKDFLQPNTIIKK